MHNKHIAKEKIELEFEKLLESVKPSDRLLNLANAIMNERWALKEQQHNSEQVMVSRKTNDLQEQADGLLRRLAKATDDSITDMYESEVIRLKGEIANLNRTKSNKQFTNAELGTASQIVTEALKNPNTMWKSDTYTDQRTLLLMYFEQGLTYSVNTGFGTATLSYPLALIKGFENEQSLDVHRLGFEPR